MRATHNGTCQVCGNIQAVKSNGRLAKHGYTVEYGFFNGTCRGSDELPLEHDRELADATMESVGRELMRLTTLIEAGPESLGKVFIRWSEKVPGDRYHRRQERTEWMDRERFAEHAGTRRTWSSFEDQQRYTMNYLRSQRRGLILFREDLLERVNTVPGQPLQER